MFFYIFSLCILKDAEWSKTYVFHERENFGSKGKYWENIGKILGKMSKILMNTLARMSQNIFAYFSILKHSASFSLFWLRRGGLPLPLFTFFLSVYVFHIYKSHIFYNV